MFASESQTASQLETPTRPQLTFTPLPNHPYRHVGIKVRRTPTHYQSSRRADTLQQHVVIPKQPPHQHDIALQQPATTDPIRRGRRRHRRRLAPLESSSRLLHRKGPAIPPMAATRPESAAARARAIRIFIWATASPRPANGSWRRRRRRRTERPLG